MQGKNPKSPLNVIVLGSGVGTNFDALVRYQKSLLHPLFQIRLVLCDQMCRMVQLATQEKIPVIVESFKNFFLSQSCSDYQDLSTRIAYDRTMIHLIQQHATEFNYSPDLIILAGYRLILHEPFFKHFSEKIITVHPADLSVLDSLGRRKYVGNDAIRSALSDGTERTRSTVIGVNPEMDEGPILASGPWVNYTEGYPLTKDRIKAHQTKQKKISDWPALIACVKLIALNRLKWTKNKDVYLDCKLLPATGYDLGDRCNPILHEVLQCAEY